MNGLSERLKLMTNVEQELLGAKLLLLTAQMALEAHGEFSLASKISDFLSTPFASTEGEQVSCGTVEGHGPMVVRFERDTATTTNAESGNADKEKVNSEYQASPAGIQFPRAHPSSAGNGAVFPARPQIHLCNKERRSIVRSAEERGK